MPYFFTRGSGLVNKTGQLKREGRKSERMHVLGERERERERERKRERKR
jgi:hypothetical protein